MFESDLSSPSTNSVNTRIGSSSSTMTSPLGIVTDARLNSRASIEHASPRDNSKTRKIEKAPERKRVRVSSEKAPLDTFVSRCVLPCGTTARSANLASRLMMRELCVGATSGKRFYSPMDAKAHELRWFSSRAEHDVHAMDSLPFAATSAHETSIAVVGGEDGGVHLIDTDVRKDMQNPLLRLACHDNAIFDLAFSPDDTLLGTASGDQTARIFDLHRQTCVAVLWPYDGHSVKQVVFVDAHTVATSTRGGTISIFDTRVRTSDALPIAQICRAQNADKGRRAEKSVHARSVTALAVVDQNTLVSAGEGSPGLRKWDLRKLSLSKRYVSPLAETAPGGTAGVTSVVVDRLGARIWALTRNSILSGYSIAFSESAEPIEVLKDKRLRVDSFYVKISAASESAVKNGGLCGGYVACGSSDDCAVVFPCPVRGRGQNTQSNMTKTGTAFVGAHKREVTAVSWTCDGELISISDDTTVRRWHREREPVIQIHDKYTHGYAE